MFDSTISVWYQRTYLDMISVNAENPFFLRSYPSKNDG